MTDILNDIAEATPEQIAEILAILSGSDEQEPKATQSEKVKCKVCGFHKKARRVGANGVCKVCAEAVKDGGDVEVIGRMGKRGRNTVSVVIDGQRFTVKRLSSKHSERVAAKYASKGKGYARKPKAHVSDIVSPKGLPTCSRVGADAVQRIAD